MKTIIFDIDGTLADLTHRLPLTRDQPKQWEVFHESAAQDKPISPIIEMCWKYLLDPDWHVLFCTGRPESSRETTLSWLASNRMIIKDGLLYMRPDKDRRKDWIVKSEMLDEIQALGHDVQLVVEDRKQCVDMWRDRGIICLQCDEGDY
jgi:hydroxymethylpyrimidine pyrophosphatase-like HAD family hydrolase